MQSRIQDAADYLFQDQSPDKTLRDATETVVRKTIGGSQLDFILTEGRSAVAEMIRERAQTLINQYKTGLQITSVNMQPAKPPEQVKEAFDDAIKAREDKERLENKAEAYSNEILPSARGEAARVQADAKAYRDRVIAEAEGETVALSRPPDRVRKGARGHPRAPLPGDDGEGPGRDQQGDPGREGGQQPDVSAAGPDR